MVKLFHSRGVSLVVTEKLTLIFSDHYEADVRHSVTIIIVCVPSECATQDANHALVHNYKGNKQYCKTSSSIA